MIVLVLPAFNEAPNLHRLLGRVEQTAHALDTPLRVLVVDDGSTDDTAQAAHCQGERLSVDVIAHARNRGLAAAIKTGLSGALSLATDDDDLVVTMDADDTHAPELIVQMAAYAREGYDLIVASRFTPGARVRGLTWARRIYSQVAAAIFRLVAPMPGIRDYTCGYRAYRAGFLKRVWDAYGDEITTETGFSCMADILLHCRPFHPKATEVPLDLRYDRKAGVSKMRVGRTIVDTLRLLVRARLG